MSPHDDPLTQVLKSLTAPQLPEPLSIRTRMLARSYLETPETEATRSRSFVAWTADRLVPALLVSAALVFAADAFTKMARFLV